MKRARILVDVPVSKAKFNLMTCNSQGEHVELNGEFNAYKNFYLCNIIIMLYFL